VKTLLKIVGVFVGVLVVLIAGVVVYVNATARRDFSSVPMPSVKASTDPAVVAQGEYLVHAVAHCSACHGPAEKVNLRQLGEKHEMQGGFELKAGPFGTFRPANLTSCSETGLGKFSDGEIARAVAHGVDRTGGFAPMMTLAVGNMSQEDLTAIISYLRTVAPIKNSVPPDEWGFIAKALSSKFSPRNDPPMKHVAPGGISVERGEYLANGPALCSGCHSAIDPMAGFKIVGPKFQGSNQPEPDPNAEGMVAVPPNLTPDPETGHITSWDEEKFVARFKAGRAFPGTKMPWESFKQMTEDDMRSIYRYLRTLAPVKNFTGPHYRKSDWTPEQTASR
jgi:mono/diheme cytochrome c family protein